MVLRKEVKIDEGLVNSLVTQSEKKLITENYSPLNEDTANTKITLSYDSLREILEAIAIEKGYKIYNHDPGELTDFLLKMLKTKEVLNRLNYDLIKKVRGQT
jgi:hypothetical protein